MSSFYIAVNTTKRQYILPHAFGDGMRFTEFAASSHGMMFALAALLVSRNETLATSSPVIGSWAGDSVVLAADNDAGRFVPGPDALAAAARLEQQDPQVGAVLPEHLSLFTVARVVYEDVSVKVKLALHEDAFARFWMQQSVRGDGHPKARA
jgi:hypothetical protein